MSFGLCGRLSLTQQIELHPSPSRSISTLSSTSSDTMSPSKQASGAPASSSNQGEEEEAVLNNTSTVTADADVAECPAASTETEQGQDAADDEVQDVTADHLRAIQKEKSYIKFRSPPKSIFKKTGTKWWTVHHVDFAHIRSLKRRLKTEISANELETMGGILRCFEILDEASEDDPQEEVYESIAKRLFVCPRCFDNASSPLLKATILCTEGVSSNIGQHNLRVHEELPEKKSEPLLENSKQPLMSSYSQPMKSREETVQTFRTKVYEFINDNGFPASTVEKPNFRDLLSFTIKHAPRLSSQDVVISNQEVANEVPNDGNDNNDNDSEVSEDDAFNIFASYKAAQDREANARRMTTGGNGGQNNKQVLRDKLYEKINDEFGQFMDYSERMVQSSWESHIRKFPSAVFRKESATWTPKQWSRFKVACNKLLFSRVGKYFDVLSWWAIFKDRFPQIFPTAIIWTAKPATNAFQERVFSTASLMDANKRMNRQLDKNFEMRTLGCLTRPLVEMIWKREKEIMNDEKKKREAEGGGEEDAVVVVDDSQWWTEDEEDEARSVPTTGGVKPTQDEETKTQAKKHQVPIGQLAEDSTQGEMLRMEQIVRATNSYQEHLDKGNSLDEGILMEPYKFSANDNDEVADDRSVDSVEILDIVDMTDIDQVEMMDRGRTYQTTDDSDFALVTVAREEKETLKAYASVIGGDTDKDEALNNNQVSENGPGDSMKTPSSSARKRKGSVDATPTSAASSSTKQKQKRARKAPGSKGSRSSKNPSKRRQTKLQQAFPKKKPPPTTENTTEQEQPAAASKESSASASSSPRKGTWTSPRTKK